MALRQQIKIAMKSSNKIQGAGFLLVANLIVNLGNYGLNIVLGRWLGPEGFAEANILATFVMILSFVAMGVQLVVAKYSAELNVQKEDSQLDVLLYSAKRIVTRSSVILTIALLCCAPLLKNYLNFTAAMPLIIIALGLPSYFLMSTSRGYYQGLSQFKKLAQTYLTEMIVRVIVTLGLIALLSAHNMKSEAVALGFLFSFIATHAMSHLKTNTKTQLPLASLVPMIKFFGIMSVYELSQILINNSDVILVKHHFESLDAGLYASLALLGRAVFFATWIIVTILFPTVIEKEKKGEPHQHLFWNALKIVAGIGTVIVGTCYFLNDFIINTAFGNEYTEIAHLLWMYALSTTLFACANIFVYYNMSLEKYAPVWISVIAGVLQILCINLFHQSLEMVIQVQLILMSVLLGVMMIYQKTRNTYQKKKTPILHPF